jgi:hypothetical protein
VLVILRYVGDRCDMAGIYVDRGKCMRLGAEDRGLASTGRVLSGWVIERSCDAVCGMYRARGEEDLGFLGLASKTRSMVSPGLATKSVATVFMVFQNHSPRFPGLGLKICSCNLVIQPTKSPRRFLGLGLKT